MISYKRALNRNLLYESLIQVVFTKGMARPNSICFYHTRTQTTSDQYKQLPETSHKDNIIIVGSGRENQPLYPQPFIALMKLTLCTQSSTPQSIQNIFENLVQSNTDYSPWNSNW